MSRRSMNRGKGGNNRANRNRRWEEGKDTGYRNFNKRVSKHGYKKPFEEETIEDVRADIARIEKEISLEIKEIKSLKL